MVLVFMCCHPALSPASQVALTLRAVGGLTTAEISRVFLVPEATMTRRITRAKQAIADGGHKFTMPEPDQRAARLAAVLRVVYLIFTEGYASTSAPDLLRPDLSAEAIRLARTLRALLPSDAEVTGLLALLLLTDARRPARTGPGGLPIPMAEQDRGKWDTARIAEGTALVTEALRRGPPGPYQVQAAIAALHDEAPTAAETDWPQILALYEVLMQASDNPVVALNHAVAAAMVHGPRVGLDLLENVGADQRIAAAHRLHAVRANLLEMAGDLNAARDAYLRAAELTASPPHQRYLNARAARLADQAS
jgi:predicted RNA polymerase sigma factor